MQVESELEMARKKIDDITKRIETTRIGPRKRNDSLRRKFTGPQLHAPQRSREVHEDRGRTISRDCQFFNNRLTKKNASFTRRFSNCTPTSIQSCPNFVYPRTIRYPISHKYRFNFHYAFPTERSGFESAQEGCNEPTYYRSATKPSRSL